MSSTEKSKDLKENGESLSRKRGRKLRGSSRKLKNNLRVNFSLFTREKINNSRSKTNFEERKRNSRKDWTNSYNPNSRLNCGSMREVSIQKYHNLLQFTKRITG